MSGIPDFLANINAEEFLEEATGKGVKVGILDTGLDAEHSGMSGVRQQLRARISFLDGTLKEDSKTPDPTSHGTPVTWIINQVAPEAELYFIQALSSRRGSARVFEKALKYAIEQNFDVINLSLGLESFTDSWKSRFIDLVDQAFYRGTVLVAAASNNSDSILPGCLSSLISVDMDHFHDPLQFRPRDRQNILYGPRPNIWLDAKGAQVRAPKAGGDGQFYYTGTSFATPHVSGIVARLLSKYPDLQPFEVKTLLYRIGLTHL